jgi:hypothetical protein
MNKALLFLPLMAALHGCNTQPPIDPRAEEFGFGQVQLADEDLRRNTRFSEPQVSRDAAGLLYVTVPLRATINETLYVQYRATFFDEHGQPLPGSGATWTDKTLNPRVPETLSANSTSPRAADFRVDVRYAR